MKGTVVHINGGLGKCIMFTCVAKCFKEQYPDLHLIVVSGYPEVFLNNPNIDGNFAFTQHGLWAQLYKKEEYEVMAWDPYFHQDWIKNTPRHLVEIWSELLDVDCLNLNPELYFSGPEVEELQRMIQVDRPLLVVQSTGGTNPGARSWTRNPPQAELEQYLQKFSDSHYIVHLAVPGTPALAVANQRIENLTRRQAMCLVYYAQEFVGIDSFGLHARAANPNAGPSHIFIILPWQRKRIGYESDAIYYVPVNEEVEQLLEQNYSYYANVSQYSIEEAPENCPVPAGVKWFDI
jgi:ADP-heptose:LPS heptosyltransferase